jgi:hypothetical protein
VSDTGELELPPGDGPLALPGPAFWSSPYQNRAAVLERLSRDGFEGVVIDAPRRILPDAESWPVVGYRADSLRAWQRVGLEPHAVFCAAVLGEGRCLVAPAFEWRPLFRRPQPREPEDPGEGRASQGFTLDLRKRLRGLRWGRDELCLRVVLADQVSNAVLTGFGRPPWEWQDPEVARFLAAERARLHPGPVWPARGEAGASYAGEAPGEEGIALKVISPVPAGGAAIVLGSWRLPLPLGATVRPDHPQGGVGDPQATCVVPLTLVLVAEHAPGVPWSLALQLPSHEAPGPDADDPQAERPRVGGRFRLDLFQTSLLSGRQPGRYHLYAFSEQAMAGPASFDVEAP